MNRRLIPPFVLGRCPLSWLLHYSECKFTFFGFILYVARSKNGFWTFKVADTLHSALFLLMPSRQKANWYMADYCVHSGMLFFNLLISQFIVIDIHLADAS